MTRGLDILLLRAGLGVRCGCWSLECFETQGKGLSFQERVFWLIETQGVGLALLRGDGSQDSGRSGGAAEGLQRWGGSEHTRGQGVAGPPGGQGAQAQLLLRPPCFSPAPPRRRKSSEEAVRERQQVVSLAARRETSLLRFYVSREWLNKFNSFAEPGPITNHSFLCSHGGEGAASVARVRGSPAERPPVPLSPSSAGIPPNKYHYIDDLVVILPQDVWEYLYNR